MANLEVKLHPKQLEVFNDNTRFKVISAGRRFGKSRLAAWMLIIKALQSTSKDVFYVAPTYQQAKDIMWGLLKEIGHEVIKQAHENTSVLTLLNGRKIYLKGADRPDTLRGVGLSFLVIDEYADIKANVWEQILRPALADVKGDAMFIGTPKGRNHFYELFRYASKGKDSDWKGFHYTSFDNPLLDASEIEAARQSMSSFAFKQEFMASFEAASSDVFKEEWLKYGTEPKEGLYYIAIDLAGFEDVASQTMAKKKLLDETAIAVVKVNEEEWYVAEIIHGRWDIKETANNILKAVDKYTPIAVGIEKGSLKNAVMPYLTDLMRRYNRFFKIEELTHGNKRKTDRVVWALQGRFEHGRVVLNEEGKWINEFVDQLLNFPNTQMHDDLIDALSYVDQIAVVSYKFDEDDAEEWEPLNMIAGY